MKTDLQIKLYRDDKGRPRKTKTGHYRFDAVLKSEAGVPILSVVGFRLDYGRRRILPVTVARGSTNYLVAEVAPEHHQHLVDELCSSIAEALEIPDEAPTMIRKSHRFGCRNLGIKPAEECGCREA